MRKHANADPQRITAFRAEFSGALGSVHATLGDKPFHLFAGFNSSAFDSVFSAFARHLGQDLPSNMGLRYATLRQAKEFEALVRGGTTDVDQVRDRMKLAESQLFG